MDIEPSDTVERIKERLEEQEGIAPDQQRLIFSGVRPRKSGSFRGCPLCMLAPPHEHIARDRASLLFAQELVSWARKVLVAVQASS